MLSGIGIPCFATSYAISLILEITRLFFRSGVRGAVMLGFAGVGLVFHTAFLCHRAIHSGGSPLSSEMDWYLVAAWALVATYLHLTYYYPRAGFGLFVLPLVLGLIGTAQWFADAVPFGAEPASRVWGAIHGTTVVLATVAVLVGFVAGLMYLVQARRLKHKIAPMGGLRLPSLERLQQTNSRAIVSSVLMLGTGVLSGIVLDQINTHRDIGSLPLTDPFVFSTLVMLLWLLIAAGIILLYRPARVGRKVVYLTLFSFVFLVLALAAGLFLDTQHGGLRPAQVPSTEPAGEDLFFGRHEEASA